VTSPRQVARAVLVAAFLKIALERAPSLEFARRVFAELEDADEFDGKGIA